MKELAKEAGHICSHRRCCHFARTDDKIRTLERGSHSSCTSVNYKILGYSEAKLLITKDHWCAEIYIEVIVVASSL